MTATFPNGIASFTQKVDNRDVNYAADINRIQDELVAVQQVLGTLITTVTDLHTEVVSDESQDAQFQTQATLKFSNLGERLDWLQNGYQTRAAIATVSNTSIPGTTNTGLFQSSMPTLLKLQQPPAQNDPYGLWNGASFTLNKSGFWIIYGQVRYDLGGANPKNAGVYQAALEYNGEWVHGMDRKEVVNATWANVFLHPVHMGWFNAGDVVRLRTSHTSAQAQNVGLASLQAVWVRSPGGSTTTPGNSGTSGVGGTYTIDPSNPVANR